MLMILNGSCMANPAVNYEFIVLIIGISIKVVNLSILDNIPVNIFPMNTKSSTRFKF